jgi:hypothetical protein
MFVSGMFKENQQQLVTSKTVPLLRERRGESDMKWCAECRGFYSVNFIARHSKICRYYGLLFYTLG